MKIEFEPTLDEYVHAYKFDRHQGRLGVILIVGAVVVGAGIALKSDVGPSVWYALIVFAMVCALQLSGARRVATANFRRLERVS